MAGQRLLSDAPLNVYLNGIDIRVETFDITSIAGSDVYKMDILLYNNINIYGEVISSMVYNSGAKLVDDTSLIVYNPNKLLLNSSFENTYNISGTESNVWKNNTIITGNKSNLKDNSRGASYSYSHYTTADYSVPFANGEYMYDGWYTLCSVLLPTTLEGAPVTGSFRFNTVPQYYNGATWVALTSIPNQAIAIYDFLRAARNESYIRKDFVVTTKIETLYNQLLNESIEGCWFKKLNYMKPKLSTIKSAIEFERFDVAQHMIKSVNVSLLSILI
jgi:hypothetical protein